MKQKKLFANLALLLTAFIWGTAFVAQSVGMEHIGPFTFQWIRSFIGAIALVPVILIRDSHKKKQDKYEAYTPVRRKTLLTGGILCGVILCIASNFQQVGIQYTTVGNAGFITSMYMILVPILSLFLKKKVPAKIWLCVILAATGMYFLSISDTLSISKGDALVAVCAVFFALQILVVDYFIPKVDGVKLSFIQLVVTGVLSMIPSFLFETLQMEAFIAAVLPILYAGVLSSGVAYTLQIVAQKYAEPTVATLFMSLESVFSLLGGIVVLSQIPTKREILGCILVFSGVLLSQINMKTAKNGQSVKD